MTSKMRQGLLMLGLLLAAINIQAETHFSGHEHMRFFFSKPFSGAKCDHYEVSLEFPNNDRRKYLIPDDCPGIINEVSFGSAKPNNIIDRNLWSKVINDCRYVVIMPNRMNTIENDFVSKYDYFNARLEDLPFDSDCEATDDAGYDQECLMDEKDKLSISSFFPFLEINKQQENVEYEECRFTEGVFRGQLIRTDDGLRCLSDKRARGLRLLSVDHGDLNNDGYEDVILRIMPLGRGVSRLPILLPLTRYQESTPFSVPKDISTDFMIGR